MIRTIHLKFVNEQMEFGSLLICGFSSVGDCWGTKGLCISFVNVMSLEIISYLLKKKFKG